MPALVIEKEEIQNRLTAIFQSCYGLVCLKVLRLKVPKHTQLMLPFFIFAFFCGSLYWLARLAGVAQVSGSVTLCSSLV